MQDQTEAAAEAATKVQELKSIESKIQARAALISLRLQIMLQNDMQFDDPDSLEKGINQVHKFVGELKADTDAYFEAKGKQAEPGAEDKKKL